MSLHKSATTKNIAELRMETGTSAFKRELCKQCNAPICSNCSRTFSHRNTPTYSSMPTASTSISHFSMLSTMCTSTPARAKRRKSHESPAQAPASQAENRRNASCGLLQLKSTASSTYQKLKPSWVPTSRTPRGSTEIAAAHSSNYWFCALGYQQALINTLALQSSDDNQGASSPAPSRAPRCLQRQKKLLASSWCDQI